MTRSNPTKSHQDNHVDDEETPLLAKMLVAPTGDPDVARAGTLTGPSSTAAVDAAAAATTEEVVDKPLPKAKLFFLCYARMVEPIVFFGIFPFVNQMVQKNGDLDEADVGFYSGLIESLFSVTQMVVMIFWGLMADRIGRKPVLVTSLLGVAVTAALFGFARSIWQMILFRCLAGVFAGSIVTIRTMITELSTKKTQARAFSFFAFAGNLGMFLGPLIGGALADPARQYGGVFSRVALCRDYPYALSTLTTGAVGLSSTIVVFLFVEETKSKTTVAASVNGAEPSSSSSSSSTSLNKSQPKSTWEILRYPGVGTVLYLYGHSMLLGFAYTAVVPVFWFTSPALGGFGFSPFYISLFMGLTGFSQAIWLLVVFPPFHKRVGTGGVLRICGNFYPFVFIPLPAFNLLLRMHNHAATIAFWVIGPPFMAIAVGVSMVFTAMQLAVNDISPSPETLGTLNALALTLVSGIRAFSPWLFTSIFAFGVRSQILWGYLIWLVMAVLALMYAFAVRWLPARAAGNGETTTDEES